MDPEIQRYQVAGGLVKYYQVHPVRMNNKRPTIPTRVLNYSRPFCAANKHSIGM